MERIEPRVERGTIEVAGLSAETQGNPGFHRIEKTLLEGNGTSGRARMRPMSPSGTRLQTWIHQVRTWVEATRDRVNGTGWVLDGRPVDPWTYGELAFRNGPSLPDPTVDEVRTASKKATQVE
jgi:hypothetical protein